MKSQINSKIATIVYKEYTENVDMNNPLFKQSELNALIKNDKNIIRVDYYINNTLVGNKMYTPTQAASQIKKMNITAYKIGEQLENVSSKDWYKRKAKNEIREAKINEINNKIKFYTQFLNEEVYNEMLASDMCCGWEDFRGE